MKKEINEGIVVYGYGHQIHNSEINLSNWCVEDGNKINIIAGHFCIKELQRRQDSGISISTNDITNWNANMVFLGHDHSLRFLKYKGKTIASYVGAPFNIYEEEWLPRGVIICDIGQESVDISVKTLECPSEFKVKAKNYNDKRKIATRYGPVSVGEYIWEYFK